VKTSPVFDFATDPQAAFNDPHKLAATFLLGRHWRYHREEFFEYDGTKYNVVPKASLLARLNMHVKRKFDEAHPDLVAVARKRHEEKEANKRHPASFVEPHKPQVSLDLLHNVRQAVCGFTLVPNDFETPGHLSDPGRKFIAFANGLLDLNTDEFIDHTPDWFSTVCLPFEYDPEARCEEFLQMLHRCLGGDADKIKVVQEIFGYCLDPDTRLKRVIVLGGVSNGGKSAVLAVQRALLGEANRSYVALEEFHQRFALWPTIGKLANIAGDVDQPKPGAVSVIKKFTGSDGITIDRKGIAPWQGQPTAKLIFATNSWPRFQDRSEAVWDRLVPVKFDIPIPEADRNPNYKETSWWRSSGQMPGVFNWALEGLRRLQANGRFTETSDAKEVVAEIRKDAEPGRRFLLKNFREQPGAREALVKSYVYQCYQTWYRESGYPPQLVLNADSFHKLVHEVFPSADKHQISNPKPTGPRRPWCWSNIHLITDEERAVDQAAERSLRAHQPHDGTAPTKAPPTDTGGEWGMLRYGVGWESIG
jgi:P4 family phage/plasmid primase-like protien